jgi:diaminopimelate epimerase
MKLPFVKMHGTGNDYIYIDCFKHDAPSPEQLSVALSHRRFGIGGDGVILICPSDVADAKMRMFNADGSEGRMCGNGIRCVGKYIYDEGVARKDVVTVETLSGVKTLDIHAENGVAVRLTVNMGKPEFAPEKIPVCLPGDGRVISRETVVAGGLYTVTCVSMGNPHCVIIGKDPDTLELEKIGPKFERDPIFPEGINTEFICQTGENALKMRVWERGSGETWACGTGACAAVVAAVENGLFPKDTEITVQLKGGDLVIRYADDSVYMTGGAVKVFDGVVDVS